MVALSTHRIAGSQILVILGEGLPLPPTLCAVPAASCCSFAKVPPALTPSGSEALAPPPSSSFSLSAGANSRSPCIRTAGHR